MPTYTRNGLSQQKPTLTQLGNPVEEAKCLALMLVRDLIASGFNVYTVDDDLTNAGDYTNDVVNTQIWTTVTLTPTAAVDPLAATDPWMIRIRVAGSGAGRQTVNGTTVDITHPNTGLYIKVGSFEMLSGTNIAGPAISEYALIPPTWGGGIIGDQGTILGAYAGPEFARISPSFPMTYRLTVAARGFVFAAWHQVFTEDMTKMGVVCVQHGVKCDGAMEDEDTRPLIMVTNINPTNVAVAMTGTETSTPRSTWFYQIIRTADEISPFPQWTNVSITMGSPDGIIYTDNTISDNRELKGSTLTYYPVRWYTPVTTDQNEYILKFAYGFASSRFVHPEELDLLAISKGEAYQSGQTIPITVYGEERKYTALNSNNQNVAYDGGIRIFVLTEAPDL